MGPACWDVSGCSSGSWASRRDSPEPAPSGGAMTSDFAALRTAAAAALNEGDLLQVGRLAQGMVKARPQDAEGHFFFGLAAEAIGRTGLALQAVDEAIRIAS